MPTDEQIQANRANAQHSTGPRTPEGKARSSANRTTHALTGRHAVLPTESPAAFDQLLANLRAEWNPQSETESQQVELLAHHWWRLLRIARLENDAFTRPLEIRHPPPCGTGNVTGSQPATSPILTPPPGVIALVAPALIGAQQTAGAQVSGVVPDPSGAAVQSRAEGWLNDR